MCLCQPNLLHQPVTVDCLPKLLALVLLANGTDTVSIRRLAAATEQCEFPHVFLWLLVWWEGCHCVATSCLRLCFLQMTDDLRTVNKKCTHQAVSVVQGPQVLHASPVFCHFSSISLPQQSTSYHKHLSKHPCLQFVMGPIKQQQPWADTKDMNKNRNNHA